MYLRSRTNFFKFSKEEDEHNDSELELEDFDNDILEESVGIENNITNICNVLDVLSQTENNLSNTQMYDRNTKEVDENITEDIVNIATEGYIYTLGMLGVKSHELKYVNFSKEEFTPKQRLELSLEGILDTLKTFFQKVIDLLIAMGKKIKQWVIKIGNFLSSGKSLSKKIKLQLHDIGNVKWTEFNQNNSTKIKKWLGPILLVTNNKINVQTITNYFSPSSGNPIMAKLNTLFKYINIPKADEDDGIKQEKMKVVEDIRSISCNNALHKALIEAVEANENGKCYFITNIKGVNISYYGIKSEEDRSHGLPIKYLKTKLSEVKDGNVKLEGVSTYKDFEKLLDTINANIENRNKKFNEVLKMNNEAIKLVKQYRDTIANKAETGDGLKEAMRRNLSFLQSMGSNLAFDYSYQYGNLNSNLLKVIKLAIEQQNKGDSPDSVSEDTNDNDSNTNNKKKEAKPVKKANAKKEKAKLNSQTIIDVQPTNES